MITPDLSPIVEQTASAFRHLLVTNTYDSCLEFTQRVLMACGDPAWGHVGKTLGEGQAVPPGFSPHFVRGADGILYMITGVSHDAIFHRPTNQQIDILSNGSANSDPDISIHGPAGTQWNKILQQHNRVNNPWIAAIPAGMAVPAPPTVLPSKPAYLGDAYYNQVSAVLEADYHEAGQTLNAGSGCWFGRVDYEIYVEGMTPEAAINRHRPEWRAALGLPPV